MWSKQIKIAIRSLFKSRLFTAINVLGLTIGMASTLLIYIWVQNELTFDRYYQNSDNIYRVLCHWNGAGSRINIRSIPLRLKETAEAKIPDIKECYLLHPDQRSPLVTLEDGTVFEEKDFAYVSKSWFEAFDYQILEGSLPAFYANKNSIALTKKQATKYFGDQSAIGKTLELHATVFTVRVILKEMPTNSSFQFTAYLPLEAIWANQAAYEEDYHSGNYNYIAFFKTETQAAPEKIAEQLAAILNETDDENRNTCSLVPIDEVRFYPDLSGDYFPHQDKSTVYIFAIIGLILLLTAGLNYINLSTVLISKRVKEFGIKKVIGANFQHIFSQVMLETLLTSLCAFLGAIAIVNTALPLLSNFVEVPLHIDFTQTSVWGILLGMVLLNLLVAGIYPAVMSASFKPIQLINGRKIATKGAVLRKALVVAQFAAVVIVLISTLVMYQQLLFVQQKNVGYDRAQVIKIRPNLFRDGNIEKNFEQFKLFKEALAALPEFEAVALTDGSVSHIDNQNSGSLSWAAKPANLTTNVYQLRADEELLSVFDLQLAEGRWFSPDLASDQENIILNETAVRRFNIPQPVIGRKSSFQGREGQIIGVVKDFNFENLHESIEPLVIWHHSGRGHTILAKINAENTTEALQKAEAQFGALLPGIFFKYTFLEETFQQMHEADAQIGLLFQIFAGLLIFISCLGLFGLTVFSAELRIKEVGVRKVLGASVANIVQLLSKDFLWLVFLAILIAIPIAGYFVNHWLQSFAYHIELQWWMFAIAGVLALLIAFVTISFQSVKAALANPVASLRNE